MVYENLVSTTFKSKVQQIASDLNMKPDWLMVVMYFETAKTFSPKIRNGSAVGLIQFTPVAIAEMNRRYSLNITTNYLASISAIDQLDFVRLYFKMYPYNYQSVGDVYIATFNPANLGKPDNYVLYSKGQGGYESNKALDFNNDGVITISDIKSKIGSYYSEPENTGFYVFIIIFFIAITLLIIYKYGKRNRNTY